MKNPAILKGELGILKADRSAVLKELREVGVELKNIYIQKDAALAELAEVRNTILEETARLDDMWGRAVLVKKELEQYTQDLRNIRNTWETVRVKNSQEQKLHLGRIKELVDKEEKIKFNISILKQNYDNNSNIYMQHETERKAKLRALDVELESKTKLADEIEKKLKKDLEEDKKITKERLKREDKLRIRESNVEAKEKVIKKKEEDLMTMSVDMAIVYGRLKELCALYYPQVDLDKLIKQAI